MCDFCKINTGVDYIITSKNNKLMICPNCLTEEIFAGAFKIKKGNLESEISKSRTAVEITQQLPTNEKYILTPQEAIRLFSHMLLPEEYKILTRTHPTSEYLLHEDFYDDDGFAVQPLLKDKYEYLLRNTKDEILNEYVKTNAPFKRTNEVLNLVNER